MRIAITTSPRENADYLPQTLESLNHAGWVNPVLVAEPGSRLPSGFDVLQNEQSLGPWPNFRNALSHLHTTWPDEEWYAVFQDDALFTNGLAAWLVHNFPPESPETIGVVSLYTSSTYHQSAHGWAKEQEVSGRKSGGALAILIPNHAVPKLLHNPPYPASRTNTDRSLGEFCRLERLSYWRHNPSFVKHIGDVSAIAVRNRVGFNPAVQKSRNCESWLPRIADIPESA